MPEYLAPGVYVEEVPSGIKPIEGVSTSTAGFLGAAERGPLGAVFISSFAAYQRRYGGFLDGDNYLPDAVKGFFDNGGMRAYISRVIKGDDKLAALSFAGFTFRAIGPGAWGTNIYLYLAPASAELVDTDTPPESFKRLRLLVAYSKTELKNPLAPFNLDPTLRPSVPERLEDFDNLVSDPNSPDDIVAVVNRRSELVRIDPISTRNQASFTPLGKTKKQVTDLKAEWKKLDAGEPPKDTTVGLEPALKHLEDVDDISLVVAPDIVTSSTKNDVPTLISSCERLRDRVVLLSSRGDDQQTDQPIAHGQDSSYAAFYHPWIKVATPRNGGAKKVPPIGHVAGICARSDILRGVHKAPANEIVQGALDLEVPVSKAQQDTLNPRGINCIRDFRADNRGIRLWGARTTSSDPEWRYLNVRRLFLFIEESIDQGTQWVVFEPNSDPTWAAVRRNITNFLTSVWRSGALMGNTPDEAFFVRCDYPTTMTEGDIEAGRLICVIGVAPVRPAEFVIFRISQKTLEAAAS